MNKILQKESEIRLKKLRFSQIEIYVGGKKIIINTAKMQNWHHIFK